MEKRIRYFNCPDPMKELEVIDNMYLNWLNTRSIGYRDIILSRINKLQPYIEFELLYEGINF